MFRSREPEYWGFLRAGQSPAVGEERIARRAASRARKQLREMGGAGTPAEDQPARSW
jgi:hypothetical protein